MLPTHNVNDGPSTATIDDAAAMTTKCSWKMLPRYECIHVNYTKMTSDSHGQATTTTVLHPLQHGETTTAARPCQNDEADYYHHHNGVGATTPAQRRGRMAVHAWPSHNGKGTCIGHHQDDNDGPGATLVSLLLWT